MAMYNFICEECGHNFVKVRPMSKYKSIDKCPKCKGKANHSIALDHKAGGTDCMMREYEFEGSTGTRMYAASYLPNQIDEARALHKGTDFRYWNGCYIPVIKNRNHKLRYLKEMGYEEKD